jgi:hypothetical protein
LQSVSRLVQRSAVISKQHVEEARH